MKKTRKIKRQREKVGYSCILSEQTICDNLSCPGPGTRSGAFSTGTRARAIIAKA